MQHTVSFKKAAVNARMHDCIYSPVSRRKLYRQLERARCCVIALRQSCDHLNLFYTGENCAFHWQAYERSSAELTDSVDVIHINHNRH